jgi:hypothetical protein
MLARAASGLAARSSIAWRLLDVQRLTELSCHV